MIAAATAAASSAALVVAPVPFQPQEGRGVGHVSRVEGCVGWVHRVERQGRDGGRGGDVAAARWRKGGCRGGYVVRAGAVEGWVRSSVWRVWNKDVRGGGWGRLRRARHRICTPVQIGAQIGAG